LKFFFEQVYKLIGHTMTLSAYVNG
jgi:hypothetical protein